MRVYWVSDTELSFLLQVKLITFVTNCQGIQHLKDISIQHYQNLPISFCNSITEHILEHFLNVISGLMSWSPMMCIGRVNYWVPNWVVQPPPPPKECRTTIVSHPPIVNKGYFLCSVMLSALRVESYMHFKNACTCVLWSLIEEQANTCELSSGDMPSTLPPHAPSLSFLCAFNWMASMNQIATDIPSTVTKGWVLQ